MYARVSTESAGGCFTKRQITVYCVIFEAFDKENQSRRQKDKEEGATKKHNEKNIQGQISF